VNLYQNDKGKASGLAMVPKLKFEHICLSSFSKMRVDLAAQVGVTQCHTKVAVISISDRF